MLVNLSPTPASFPVPAASEILLTTLPTSRTPTRTPTLLTLPPAAAAIIN